VGDAILAHDDRAIGKAGGNVVGKIAVDGWNDADKVVRHSA